MGFGALGSIGVSFKTAAASAGDGKLSRTEVIKMMSEIGEQKFTHITPSKETMAVIRLTGKQYGITDEKTLTGLAKFELGASEVAMRLSREGPMAFEGKPDLDKEPFSRKKSGLAVLGLN